MHPLSTALPNLTGGKLRPTLTRAAIFLRGRTRPGISNREIARLFRSAAYINSYSSSVDDAASKFTVEERARGISHERTPSPTRRVDRLGGAFRISNRLDTARDAITYPSIRIALEWETVLGGRSFRTDGGRISVSSHPKRTTKQAEKSEERHGATPSQISSTG